MKENRNFHVHDDIEILQGYPLAWTDKAEVFIMQSNRVVYIGNIAGGIRFVDSNKGVFRRDLKHNPLN